MVNWSICGGTSPRVFVCRIASATVAVPQSSFVNPIIFLIHQRFLPDFPHLPDLRILSPLPHPVNVTTDCVRAHAARPYHPTPHLTNVG